MRSFLFRHLYSVMAAADENKMGPNSLATCFGPTLVGGPQTPAPDGRGLSPLEMLQATSFKCVRSQPRSATCPLTAHLFPRLRVVSSIAGIALHNGPH